jgi:hypothetical protein
MIQEDICSNKTGIMYTSPRGGRRVPVWRRRKWQIDAAIGSRRKMHRICHPHAAPNARGVAKQGAALPPATPTEVTTAGRAAAIPTLRHPDTDRHRAASHLRRAAIPGQTG